LDLDLDLLVLLETAVVVAKLVGQNSWRAAHLLDAHQPREELLICCTGLLHAGRGRYKLMAADLVATHHMMDHIGRFLPSVRCSGAAFSFVVDLIINYGNPVLHLVMVCDPALYALPGTDCASRRHA
jgi:hypothetical protein